MIETEKTRGILIDNGANPNCPRAFLGKCKLERDGFSDQGIEFEDEQLLCKGFAESGYVLWVDQHRHPVCNHCQIKNVRLNLTRKEYLKLIS
jgi:hypothetical protein